MAVHNHLQEAHTPKNIWSQKINVSPNTSDPEIYGFGLEALKQYSKTYIYLDQWKNESIKIFVCQWVFQMNLAFLRKLLNNSKYSDDISMFLLSPLLHWLRTSKPPSEDERKVSIKLLFIFPFNIFKKISQRMKPQTIRIETNSCKLILFKVEIYIQNYTRFKLKQQNTIIHSIYQSKQKSFQELMIGAYPSWGQRREEEKQIWWSWDKLGIAELPRLTFNFARVNPFTLSNPHFFLLRGESCTFIVPSWHWISSAGIPSFSRLIFSSLLKLLTALMIQSLQKILL